MPSPPQIIELGQIAIRFLLDGDETNGSVSMFEFLVAAGAKVPVPHYHEAFDEAMYGIEGVLALTVEGRLERIGPGDRCFIRRGQVHHFINEGPQRTRTLAVVTPALLGPTYFTDIAALLSHGGPPDPARVTKVMRRHGLVAVPAAAAAAPGT
jgi:quercetin dioxygenase-like cupin family protein